MKCDDVQHLFSEYVDDELNPEQRAIVEDHVRDCPACREAWRGFSHAVQMTRALPELDPPPDLLQRVKKEVSPFPTKRKLLQGIIRPLSFKVPAWSFAAVIMVAVLYLVLIGQYPRGAVKTVTEGILRPRAEREESDLAARDEKVEEATRSLDVIPPQEKLPAEEPKDSMHARSGLKKEAHTAPGQSAPPPTPVTEEQDKISFFRSLPPANQMKNQMQIDIAGPAMNREILHLVEPQYPDGANETNRRGTVDVMCLILPSGEVEKVLIWRTSGWPEFDEHVLDAVDKWRFTPVNSEQVQAGIVRLSFDVSPDFSQE